MCDAVTPPSVIQCIVAALRLLPFTAYTLSQVSRVFVSGFRAPPRIAPGRFGPQKQCQNALSPFKFVDDSVLPQRFAARHCTDTLQLHGAGGAASSTH